MLEALFAPIKPELAHHFRPGILGIVVLISKSSLTRRVPGSVRQNTQVFAVGHMVLVFRSLRVVVRWRRPGWGSRTRRRVARRNTAAPVPGRRSVSPVPRPDASWMEPATCSAKSSRKVRGVTIGVGSMERTNRTVLASLCPVSIAVAAVEAKGLILDDGNGTFPFPGREEGKRRPHDAVEDADGRGALVIDRQTEFGTDIDDLAPGERMVKPRAGGGT